MPDPLYVTLASEYRQQLIDRNEAVTQEMVQRWLSVEQALLDDMIAAAEAAAAVQEQTGSISRSRLYQLQRYQQLLAQTQTQLNQFNSLAESQIDQAVIDSILAGLEDPEGLLRAVASEGGGDGVRLVFNRLGIAAAENIAAVARARAPLAEILARNYPLTAEAITDRLIAGIAAGYNPRKVAQSMVRDGLSQGLNHILLVARDQSNRAYREASRQQYAASGLVTKYIRIAAKQPGRTCLACIALDGTEYDTSEFMAVHPQDRCAMIPVVRRFDPPKWTAGEAYFRSLPPDVQRDWMGSERYELWKDGRFEFRQMAKIVDNDTWGPSAQVRPVRELGQ